MVDILEGVTEDIFTNEIYPKRQPVIVRNVDIGPCVEKWNVEYLSKIGGSTPTKIHVCESGQMDFLRKNFIYRTLPFNEFVQRASSSGDLTDFYIAKDEKYYMRSIGKDARKDISDISKDFPDLSRDIKFPRFFSDDDYFSSVFRISSAGCQLWTHYDIMDNILIQVKGRKRVVLFAPRDASNIYLNGDKSELIDIDNVDLESYPKFKNAKPIECFLEPGDILFIPAMWFHSVTALEFGVAVNVFWRHLDQTVYDSKDTYGNKDPLPAQKSGQILDRAVKALNELPPEYRDFYARKLVAKIENSCYIPEHL